MTIATYGATAKYAPPLLTNLPLWHQGKTRDTFVIPDKSRLLVVATDRISTHNVVHQSLIPHKGEVLTALTVFWLLMVLEKADVQHHLAGHGKGIRNYLPQKKQDLPFVLEHRAIVVERLDMVPVEFILRCYLAKAGSFYRDFYSKGLPDPYGINLPPGLPVMHRFEKPIFTPTDKSDTDDPLNVEHVMTDRGYEYRVAELVLGLVRRHLNGCGIEIVDTKFEMGHDPFQNVVLADEIATPDSSRFCELDLVRQGEDPPWLDKQLARDVAEKMWGGTKGPPLVFPSEIVKKLSDTYLLIFERITGKSLATFQREWLD